uniref:Uncharacterized protein n=1 Tax=Chromera velia CCMP2878 TaxID=1169474 RepID=A0A0G4F8Y0_9ALVE|eukprot:Cvel_15772.t1-p1 / transcript=Cvel_15772.t1 / gene=Cvel_15772 / organism=Chromera_velia_CCMP2878 / gene_product=hypothetical protein / transcript_product=hypothetical protein / location=Cvel_scaffold1182:44607-51875(+) / protein_length=1114 / sequence_SO=supercontig / SO=protein_coding / is_pseudo=false
MGLLRSTKDRESARADDNQRQLQEAGALMAEYKEMASANNKLQSLVAALEEKNRSLEETAGELRQELADEKDRHALAVRALNEQGLAAQKELTMRKDQVEALAAENLKWNSSRKLMSEMENKYKDLQAKCRQFVPKLLKLHERNGRLAQTVVDLRRKRAVHELTLFEELAALYASHGPGLLALNPGGNRIQKKSLEADAKNQKCVDVVAGLGVGPLALASEVSGGRVTCEFPFERQAKLPGSPTRQRWMDNFHVIPSSSNHECHSMNRMYFSVPLRDAMDEQAAAARRAMALSKKAAAPHLQVECGHSAPPLRPDAPFFAHPPRPFTAPLQTRPTRQAGPSVLRYPYAEGGVEGEDVAADSQSQEAESTLERREAFSFEFGINPSNTDCVDDSARGAQRGGGNEETPSPEEGGGAWALMGSSVGPQLHMRFITREDQGAGEFLQRDTTVEEAEGGLLGEGEKQGGGSLRQRRASFARRMREEVAAATSSMGDQRQVGDGEAMVHGGHDEVVLGPPKFPGSTSPLMQDQGRCAPPLRGEREGARLVPISRGGEKAKSLSNAADGASAEVAVNAYNQTGGRAYLPRPFYDGGNAGKRGEERGGSLPSVAAFSPREIAAALVPSIRAGAGEFQHVDSRSVAAAMDYDDPNLLLLSDRDAASLALTHWRALGGGEPPRVSTRRVVDPSREALGEAPSYRRALIETILAQRGQELLQDAISERIGEGEAAWEAGERNEESGGADCPMRSAPKPQNVPSRSTSSTHHTPLAVSSQTAVSRSSKNVRTAGGTSKPQSAKSGRDQGKSRGRAPTAQSSRGGRGTDHQRPNGAAAEPNSRATTQRNTPATLWGLGSRPESAVTWTASAAASRPASSSLNFRQTGGGSGDPGRRRSFTNVQHTRPPSGAGLGASQQSQQALVAAGREGVGESSPPTGLSLNLSASGLLSGEEALRRHRQGEQLSVLLPSPTAAPSSAAARDRRASGSSASDKVDSAGGERDGVQEEQPTEGESRGEPRKVSEKESPSETLVESPAESSETAAEVKQETTKTASSLPPPPTSDESNAKEAVTVAVSVTKKDARGLMSVSPAPITTAAQAVPSQEKEHSSGSYYDDDDYESDDHVE